MTRKIKIPPRPQVHVWYKYIEREVKMYAKEKDVVVQWGEIQAKVRKCRSSTQLCPSVSHVPETLSGSPNEPRG